MLQNVLFCFDWRVFCLCFTVLFTFFFRIEFNQMQKKQSMHHLIGLYDFSFFSFCFALFVLSKVLTRFCVAIKCVGIDLLTHDFLLKHKIVLIFISVWCMTDWRKKFICRDKEGGKQNNKENGSKIKRKIFLSLIKQVATYSWASLLIDKLQCVWPVFV